MDFKTRSFTNNKNSFHNDKKDIHQGDTVLNHYAPNNRASNCMNQKLTKQKVEIDNSTIIVTTLALSSSTLSR